MFKYQDVVLAFDSGRLGYDNGTPVFRAQIRVERSSDASAAQLYSDNGITPVSQPILTDASGNFAFFVDDGIYDIIVSDPFGMEQSRRTHIEIIDSTALKASAGVIGDKVVTNTKLADMTAATIKGALTTGTPSDLTPAQVAGLIQPVLTGPFNGNASTASALVASRTIALTGDVVHAVAFDGSSNVSSAATIAPKAVTNTKMADMPAATIKGATNAGAPADLSAAQVASIVQPSLITDGLGLSTTVAPSQGAVTTALSAKVAAATLAASSGTTTVGHMAPSAVIAETLSTVVNRAPLTPQPYRLPGDPDWTAAINRVCAVRSGEVRFPAIPGGYVVSDQITMNPLGNYFTGDGCDLSYIKASANFNLSALGVVVIPTTASEQSAGSDGVGIQFAQNTTAANRAALIQFPPAIYAHDVARMKYGHLKISGAFYGVDWLGNCGGLIADKIEIGAISNSWAIRGGGSLDWWKINDLTFWPWGFTPYPALMSIYQDGATVGLRSARIDGLNITVLNNLFTQIITEADGNGNGGFGWFGALHLDSAKARWDKTNGDFRVGTCYATGDSSGTYTIAQHGDVSGSLVIGSMYASQPTTGTSPIVYQDGSGFLSISEGYIEDIGANASAFYIAAGTAHIGPLYFGRSITNQARTNAVIRVGTGSRVSIFGARFADRGSGSGLILQVDQDNFHEITIRAAPGWLANGVSLPATRTTGSYQIGRVDSVATA